MNRLLKQVLATISGFASLGSGIFWHLSADLQLSAIKLSSNPAILNKMNELNPQLSKAQLDLAIENIRKTIDVFSLASAQYNLWAAILAVLAGVTLAIIVSFDVS